MKTAIKIGAFFLNGLIFLILSYIIFTIIWNYFGLEYIYGKEPIGGDYFNALTYQIFFAKYAPNPLSGWLPFWNEGFPVIGGYPFLSFYLINLLTQVYDVATAMNVFSILSLAFFFIVSLLLFRLASKNWFIAVGLTAALLATRASYNQIATGGYVVSASAQWFLPAVLIFIYLFAQSTKIRYLLIAAAVCGIALLYHAGTSFLMIFLPSILVILVLPSLGKFTKKITYLLTYVTIASLTGSMGLYSLYLQNFQGAGTDKCTSPQCWGVYPEHLITWLTVISPILLISLLFVVIVLKLLRFKVSLYSVVPALAGLLIFALYALLAHLHLISGAATVIPPTRIFWAANLFVLLAAASLFGSIQKSSWYIAYPLSAIIAAASLFYVYSNQPNIHKYVPNTVPKDAASFTPTKYQTKQLSEIVPEWVATGEPNWRVDIINGGVTHWWNIGATTPQVRGYSNNPLGIHRDWQYFLQVATRGVDENADKELSLNRALFLIDAYGIKFFENSLDAYTKEITENPDLIINKDVHFYVGTTRLLKNLTWYQLSDKITTPIVSPTTTPAILFVGSDSGYENFIRTIAMTNLNSRTLIPVKGPGSIDDVSSEQLKTFPTIILYEYKGASMQKLVKYVREGGNLFIDTGSSKTTLPKNNMAEIFPFDKLSIRTASGSTDWQTGTDSLLSEIDAQKFSPLEYQDGPWRLTTTEGNGLKPWASVYLSYGGQPVISGGQFGQGTIIWSGLNLPFHITSNNNFEEARLFKNILARIVKSQPQNPQFNFERNRPQLIKVQGENITGIYFKENYDPGWKAEVNGKGAKIYKAGLAFMYIPISTPDSQIRAQIDFRGNLITWTLFIITVISAFLTLVWAAAPSVLKLALKKCKGVFQKSFSKKITKLVAEEEY